ncbi:MAG: S8 family serine peptidase, partial [Acidobacteriota bacterium]|nr:S8 family serine peptidase [Acidobacteriota bacterium]
MKRTKISVVLTWLTCFSLVASLCSGIMLNDGAKAASRQGKGGSSKARKKDKIAADLRKQINKKGGGDPVKIIVQLNDHASGPLNSLLHGNGIKISKFKNFNFLALQVPASVVDSLGSFPEVDFASVDSEVRSLGGHIAHTTGADNVRSMGPNGNSLEGAGIGVAVLDSGVFSSHDSFMENQNFRSRVVVNQDFTGEGRTDDQYGHGTHVAAAAAGNGFVSWGKYIGIAPKANLINLRVLNSQGVGKVSSVLAALDWV